jgi:hypothetical protein
MTIGYFVEAAIAFMLTMTHLLLTLFLSNSPQRDAGRKAFLKVIRKAYKAFYNCAAFFAFSLQIAVIICLVKTDFGIDTSGMGAYTLRITWTVSVLSLLPLLYALFLPVLAKNAVYSSLYAQHERDKSTKATSVISTHLIIYFICWILSIYPFISSMISMYGPSQIGDSSNSVISSTQFGLIEDICFEGVRTISLLENSLMNGLLTTSWLFIHIMTLCRILSTAFNRNPIKTTRLPGLICSKHTWRLILLISVTFLTTAQLWTYIRLHYIQMDMARVLADADEDLKWTFGQIVAVTLFAPVAIKVLSKIRFSSASISNQHHESDLVTVR